MIYNYKDGVMRITIVIKTLDIQQSCITLGIDNQSCITLLKVLKHYENTKHIDYKYFYVKELIEGTKEDQPILVVNYTPTNQQVADFLTKAIPKPKFEFCCKAIGLITVASNSYCHSL